MVDETAKIAKQELGSAVENLTVENQQADNQQNWQSGSQQRGLQTDEQNAGESGGQYGSDAIGDQTRPNH